MVCPRGSARRDSSRGICMDEKVRLEILTTPSQDDGVRIHVEKMVTSKRDFLILD